MASHYVLRKITFMNNILKFSTLRWATSHFRFVLLVSLYILLSNFSFSQQVRHLDFAEGLNGRQALNFAQDKEGFIWISTKFGVDRYDGKNVKNYNFKILTNGKNPMREVHILFDTDSILWAYTDNGGIIRYNEKNDKFEQALNLLPLLFCKLRKWYVLRR